MKIYAANLRRRKYDYEINQKVLKKLHKPTKLGKKHEGPYNVKKCIVMAMLPSNIRAVSSFHFTLQMCNLVKRRKASQLRESLPR